MQMFRVCAFTFALLAVPLSAMAAPIGVDGKFGAEWSGITPTSIPGGSTDNGNFGAPDPNGTVPYNIYVRDDGSYFYVLLTSTSPNAGAADFANLYFDTIASTPNTGSDLGFEITNDRAFIPGVNTGGPNNDGYYYPSASDLVFATANNNGTFGIEAAISNSFFLTDPLLMPFAPTPAGTLVSIHLSQTFGLAVAGGSAAFPAPAELGDAIVGAPAAVTPEPSSLALLGTGIVGIASMVRRRFQA